MKYASIVLSVVMIAAPTYKLYGMELPDRTASPQLRESFSSVNFAEMFDAVVDEIFDEANPVEVVEESTPVQQAIIPHITMENWYEYIPESLDGYKVSYVDGQRSEAGMLLKEYNKLALSEKVVIPYPLHKAVELGQYEAVKSLIALGANILAMNAQGLMPFHMIDRIQDEKIAEQIASRLLGKMNLYKRFFPRFLKPVIERPSVATSRFYNLGLHEALYRLFPEQGQLRRIHEKMPVRAVEKEKEKARNILTMLVATELVNIPTRTGVLPLTQALESKRYEYALFLIENKANVNPHSATQNPLTIALQHGQPAVVQELVNSGAVITQETHIMARNLFLQDSKNELRQLCLDVILRADRYHVPSL